MLNTWQVDHLVLDQDEGKLHIDISHVFNLDHEFKVVIKDRNPSVMTQGKCDLVLLVVGDDDQPRIKCYEYNIEAERYEESASTMPLDEYIWLDMEEWRRFFIWLVDVVTKCMNRAYNFKKTSADKWITEACAKTNEYFDKLERTRNELSKQFEKDPIP